MSPVILWTLAALAVERITEIIHNGSIFESPRDWASRRSNFFASLLGCGFCLSVWVAAIFAWGLPGVFIPLGFLNVVLKTFILMGLSNILHELLSRWFEKVPVLLAFQRLDNGQSETVQYDSGSEDVAGHPQGHQVLHAGFGINEQTNAGGRASGSSEEDGQGEAD